MAGKLNRWTAWMDRQGFYIVLSICIAVIIGSAVWANIPLAPQDQGQTAGQVPDFVQSLADMTAMPSPEPTPVPMTWPLQGAVLRSYSPTQPLYQATLDAWSVHMGVDLAAEKGQTVVAAADGQVKAVGKSALRGLTLEIEHDNGVICRMMGLQSITVSGGERVRAGQAVATAGGSHPAEALDKPHLHLEFWEQGAPVEPLSLFP